MLDLSFTFTAPLWLWQGKGSWHFITLPEEESEQIKFFIPRRGWGSVKVSVTIGETTWHTSIFPANNLKGYILPVKAEIRKIEHLSVGQQIEVTIKPIQIGFE